MGKDAFSLPRKNSYWADPDTELCIITPRPHPDAVKVDRVDPDHEACEKNERALVEEELLDWDKRGIFTPLIVLKDGSELGIVVEGRRRTRGARIINARRRERNKNRPAGAKAEEMLKLLIMPTASADPLEIRGIMIAANVQRVGYTPMQEAAQIQDYMKMGATEKMAAAVFAKSVPWVNERRALLDCAKPVQKAVDAGQMSVSAAAAISSLTREKQEAALAKHTAGGTRLTTRKAKKHVREERTGRDVVEAPSRKQLRRTLALLHEGKGELTTEQRAVAIGTITWQLDGKLPPAEQFTLPR